jgi:release factor glutamine methyltransferase
VFATDLSSDALKVAQQNAEHHGVATRITFLRTSYLQDVPGTFDLIVANPPYVRDGDRPGLSRDVQHEPALALFGGPDGLRDVNGVLDAAVQKLAPGGWFVMEFGYGQEEDVARLIEARPSLRLDRVREDLQGIPRTAVVQKSGQRAAGSSQQLQNSGQRAMGSGQ